ncbi:MAG: hypothetical protein ACI841_000883 [Planctomycetota bacterium]|jgi:hypothetical protein
MSQIHHSELDLQGVIRGSAHVLIVSPLEPMCSRIESPDEQGVAPPFAFSRTHFRVEASMVSQDSRPIAVSAIIDVDDADLEVRRELHWSYHRSGIRKSPVLCIYRPVTPPTDDEARIVFLGTCGSRLRWTCAGAQEGLAQQDRVVSAIEAFQAAHCSRCGRDCSEEIGAQQCPDCDAPLHGVLDLEERPD